MRRNTGPSKAVRELVEARDVGCVMCGETYGLDQHHRSARRSGGSSDPAKNYPSNLILLCRDHHRWVESYREAALDRGLLVPSWRTPSEVPLMWHGDWFLLTDEGRAIPHAV